MCFITKKNLRIEIYYTINFDCEIQLDFHSKYIHIICEFVKKNLKDQISYLEIKLHKTNKKKSCKWKLKKKLLTTGKVYSHTWPPLHSLNFFEAFLRSWCGCICMCFFSLGIVLQAFAAFVPRGMHAFV